MTNLDQRLRDHFELTATGLTGPPLDRTAPARRARRRRQNRLAASGLGAAVAIVGLGVAIGLIAGDEDGSTRTIDGPDATVTVTTTTTVSTSTSTTVPDSSPTTVPLVEPAVVDGAAALGLVQEPFSLTSVESRPDLVESLTAALAPEVGTVASFVAVGDSLWVQPTSLEGVGPRVLRLDAATQEAVATIELPYVPGGTIPTPGGGELNMSDSPWSEVIDAFGSVWASTGDGFLHRIDPATDAVVASIDFRPVLSAGPWVGGLPRFRVTAGPDSFWIWPGEGMPWRVDPATNTIIAAGEVPSPALAGQAPGWVAVGERLDRVDPATGRVVVSFDLSGTEGSGLNMSREIYDVVVTDDAVWVVARASLTRIDPATDRVVATLPLQTAAGGGSAVLVDDSLLVALDATIFRVDTNTNTVDAGYGLGVSGELALVGEDLWIGPRDVSDQFSGVRDVARVPVAAVLED
ncbi:MAG: hypothetical protein R8F63_08370 [Acidimicrobiales bacterium]|nr:hypothetical protein [Acidimicrobiales bacterium]